MPSRYVITIPEVLSSYEFYRNVLFEYNEIKRNTQYEDVELLLDFSRTRAVVSLVIPNLLCLGYDWYRHSGNKALIYLTDSIGSANIKNYFINIGFIEMTERFSLFRFWGNPYGGRSGVDMDPLNTTLYFDAESTTDGVNQGVLRILKPFFDRYCSNFECYKDANSINYQNTLLRFLTSIINNSCYYGRSFSFTTLHANYSKRLIYISSSDWGGGYMSTIGQELKCTSEYDSIFAAAYKNQDTPFYGLYNVIVNVLESNGKIRFHSNDTQVVFTHNNLRKFQENRLKNDKSFLEYNVRRKLSLNGVHIEIEFPMDI